MSIHKQTVLGRLVNTEDAKLEEEKDLVLKVLYDHHYDYRNPDDIPLSLSTLSHATGLSITRVGDICDLLIENSLAKEIPHTTERFFKIASAGIQFVESTSSGMSSGF